MNAITPTRVALRWHGGKWRLSTWIIANLPPHRTYTECFGGAASVLLRKPRSHGDVYNDLDGDVVGFFRVLQDPMATSRLIELLRVTPFAREEFELAYRPTTDTVERARRLVIRSFMGFGSNGHNPRAQTGFRANANRNGTTPARDWANYPDSLAEVAQRFAGVTIDRKDAVAVMAQHDGPDTLHYVDPPYMIDTRSLRNPYDIKWRGGMYAHEMDEDDHGRLLNHLVELKGMVALSGYRHSLYDFWLDAAGWRRLERATFADGAQPRTECLWLNPAAVAALEAGRE